MKNLPKYQFEKYICLFEKSSIREVRDSISQDTIRYLWIHCSISHSISQGFDMSTTLFENSRSQQVKVVFEFSKSQQVKVPFDISRTQKAIRQLEDSISQMFYSTTQGILMEKSYSRSGSICHYNSIRELRVIDQVNSSSRITYLVTSRIHSWRQNTEEIVQVRNLQQANALYGPQSVTCSGKPTRKLGEI